MIQTLEDARKLAHGTYDDVIVVEHRRRTVASAAAYADEPRGTSPALQVVLEMPEGTRVIDAAQQYDIDGMVGDTAPTVGGSYRLIIGPSTKPLGLAEAMPAASLRYETMNR